MSTVHFYLILTSSTSQETHELELSSMRRLHDERLAEVHTVVLAQQREIAALKCEIAPPQREIAAPKRDRSEITEIAEIAALKRGAAPQDVPPPCEIAPYPREVAYLPREVAHLPRESAGSEPSPPEAAEGAGAVLAGVQHVGAVAAPLLPSAPSSLLSSTPARDVSAAPAAERLRALGGRPAPNQL